MVVVAAVVGGGVVVKCAETVGCRPDYERTQGRERQSETKEKCGG